MQDINIYAVEGPRTIQFCPVMGMAYTTSERRLWTCFTDELFSVLSRADVLALPLSFPAQQSQGGLRSAICCNFAIFPNLSQFSAIFPQFSAIFPQFFRFSLVTCMIN